MLHGLALDEVLNLLGFDPEDLRGFRGGERAGLSRSPHERYQGSSEAVAADDVKVGATLCLTSQLTLPLPARMKLHRDSSTRCGACHSHIDPIGLALEKFDPQGLWRTTYADGAPIVSDLELNGTLVRDPYELADALGTAAEFRTCVSTKLLTFALNRGPVDGEQCVIERLAEPLSGGRPTLQTLAVDALMKGIELTEVQP